MYHGKPFPERKKPEDSTAGTNPKEFRKPPPATVAPNDESNTSTTLTESKNEDKLLLLLLLLHPLPFQRNEF
jgi:hypothetical protein